MKDQRGQAADVSRRGVLRKGAKLAYVAPVVIAAMKAQPAFAGASAGPLPE